MDRIDVYVSERGKVLRTNPGDLPSGEIIDLVKEGGGYVEGVMYEKASGIERSGAANISVRVISFRPKKD